MYLIRSAPFCTGVGVVATIVIIIVTIITMVITVSPPIRLKNKITLYSFCGLFCSGVIHHNDFIYSVHPFVQVVLGLWGRHHHHHQYVYIVTATTLSIQFTL